jgi:hypothetical protein
MSAPGMCISVKEDSDLLNHVKVEDLLKLKYYTSEEAQPVEFLKTEIKHVTRDEEDDLKGCI